MSRPVIHAIKSSQYSNLIDVPALTAIIFVAANNGTNKADLSRLPEFKMSMMTMDI